VWLFNDLRKETNPMMWIDLVAVLAVLQFFAFGMLVAAARGKYGVHAPATSGHPQFERMYRVHMNTLEMLVALLPAMYLAARYWSPSIVAVGGAVYLLGRLIYWRSYTKDPASRSLGFALSFFPVVSMLVATLVGIVMKGSAY
jgi:glutathione S-transferase